MSSATGAPRPPPVKHRAFAAFANRYFRIYLFAGSAAMLSVGLLGSIIGIHNSLSYSAAALFLLYAAIVAARYVRRW